MEDALQFFKIYEVWIYLLLGLGGVIYIRKFLLAWNELRGATFGLERDSAQGRLNQAASVLVLLIMMALAEFVLVSFITPMVPGASPLPTPTLNPLATSTTTLEAGAPMAEGATPIALPTIPLGESNCIPDEIMITSPEADQVLRGELEIRGTAAITDFGFYKVEVARREEPLWLTIQAGRKPVQDGPLVATWDTSRMPAGEYVLQLVVVDSRGQTLPACRVSVRISSP